jgi:hypothetical protein
MLDKIDYKIAKELSEYHLYPYALDIYLNIFKHFSHFPLKLKDIGIKGEGMTITFMALVILRCLDNHENDLHKQYDKILTEFKKSIAPYFPPNISVETFLGCLLFYYHPVDIKNILSTDAGDKIFDKKERYEYELKKKTILMFTI